jgi:hypothetical protein
MIVIRITVTLYIFNCNFQKKSRWCVHNEYRWYGYTWSTDLLGIMVGDMGILWSVIWVSWSVIWAGIYRWFVQKLGEVSKSGRWVPKKVRWSGSAKWSVIRPIGEVTYNRPRCCLVWQTQTRWRQDLTNMPPRWSDKKHTSDAASRVYLIFDWIWC